MCVKTKTEWSCGCYKKALTTCEDAPDSRTPCAQIDKYRYLDDGDCKACRAGGATITRGQDGHGRYAREIAARERKQQKKQPRAPLAEVSGNGSQVGSVNNDKPTPVPIVIPDPWMKATRREKEWGSPFRRQADEEWEREHASRKEDIESLWESHSSSPPKQKSPKVEQVRRQPRETVHPAYPPPENELEDLSFRVRRDSTSDSSQRRSANIKDVRPQPNRHNSFESIESIPSRGRSRHLPYQYGYSTDFGYTIEDRVPRDVYANTSTAFGSPTRMLYQRRRH